MLVAAVLHLAVASASPMPTWSSAGYAAEASLDADRPLLDLRPELRQYRLGNGIAASGLLAPVVGIGAMFAIAANCQDERHGCVYAHLGVGALSVAATTGLTMGGAGMATTGLRRAGVQVSEIPLHVALGSLAVGTTAGLIGMAAGSPVGAGLFVLSFPVAYYASLVQIGHNGQSLWRHRRRLSECR